jgi:hypothetical protein
MSYRISSTAPVGKRMQVVVGEFLRSLGASADATERDNKAILALGPTETRAARSQVARTHPKGANESWGAYERRTLPLVAAIVAPQIRGRLDEIFTDADADRGWTEWTTRCEDADKDTTGVNRGNTTRARATRAATPGGAGATRP